MNAPIRYFGGKNGMANKILEYFPDKSQYTTYIEPFGGSFGVALHNPSVPPLEVYNDLDHNVFSLFMCLTDNTMFEKFRSLCDRVLYCEEARRAYRKWLGETPFDNTEEHMIERAFKFFYVNRTSMNGIGGFSVNLLVRRGMSKSCSDMLSAVEGLTRLHDRLSKVIVTSQDGIRLIRKHSQNTNTLIYADPPYHHSTRTSTRYNVDMSDETHEQFIDECVNAKCKILISGYDCEQYKRLEENGFRKVEFTIHTISGDHETKKDKTECLWMNYTPSVHAEVPCEEGS